MGAGRVSGLGVTAFGSSLGSAFGTGRASVLGAAVLVSDRGSTLGACFVSDLAVVLVSVRGSVFVSVFGAVLDSALVAVFVSVFGAVLDSVLVADLDSVVGAVCVSALEAVARVCGRDSVLGTARVSGFAAAWVSAFDPAVAGALAAVFTPAGGVTRAAGSGLAKASVLGCPPLAFANEALFARAAATCAVW
jgi:hypothetical protein